MVQQKTSQWRDFDDVKSSDVDLIEISMSQV